MGKASTVEATGKRWKGMGCLGVLLLAGGAVMLLMAWQGGAPGLWGWGGLAFGAGCVLRLGSRAGSWWFHG